jgi:uncharacterized protein YbjT (DUF2867 family)
MALRGQIVTVFGGTGFLGRRIVDRLADAGAVVRVATRHPAPSGRPGVTGEAADIRDADAVADAVRDATAVVNAVSLYVEKPRAGLSYRGIHEDGAAQLARCAARSGAARVVLISGLGADARAASRFIAARGRGEALTNEAFPGATIIRPSVMFGPGDSFFNSLAGVLRRSPVFPLIGGETRLQPVAADDVAAAVAHSLDRGEGRGETFELGGPDIVTMRRVVEWLRDLLGLRRVLLPIPLPVALAQARLLELLPAPPLTVGQVELLAKDNVAQPGAPGFTRMDLQPASFRDAVPAYIR